MIARRWHGRVPTAKAEEYLRLMEDVGLPDYRGTEGNRGAWCLHRGDGDVVHVEMFTLWDDLDAIRRSPARICSRLNITTLIRTTCSSWKQR
jgi:hypothetical protein